MSNNDPFQNALLFLDEISPLLSKLDAPYLARLKKPQKVHQDILQVRMDNGKTKEFQAYRSQHNNALGPYKGGIRFHENVSESEVKALSLWMSLKCSIAGLPLGGGKGGIIVDPKKLSMKELEALSRAYARFLAPHIGKHVDVPAPDVNTNGQIMAWMLDEYEKGLGHHSPGTFTGKPLVLGGSMGRDKATGFGGVLALRFLIERLKEKHTTSPSSPSSPSYPSYPSSPHDVWYLKPISQITIAVQGFGNVGYFFAKIASEMGFRVVAVSDSKGAIHIEEGLDPEATLECKQEKGSLAGCYCKGGVCDLRQGNMISNEDLLKLPVDVLVPSALEHVITADNVKDIKASVIVEMANGPVTPEADEALNKRNVLVVPDIYANSGGVSVSYFEWVQNNYGYYWPEAEVDQKLESMMKASFDKIFQRYTAPHLPISSPSLSLRNAAYVLAVERIIQAERLRNPL